MAKKLKVDRLWLVASGNVINRIVTTFDKAKKEGVEMRDADEEDVRIFEVVGAWQVEFPDEPQPEVFGLELKDVE